MKILLTIFYCSFSIIAIAQNIIVVKGELKDSITTLPITGGTVLINIDDQILGYGITNRSGAFEVSVSIPNNANVILVSRHISYQEKKLKLNISELSKFIKIELTPSSKTLSEVIIKSDKWIKNDTTNFVIDTSLNLKSKKVGDLLKTLPGFEVAKNGQIKYNDKSVGTVLLNGENLTGSNYGVITKNLGADILKTVQVIDNFSENRIIGSVFKTGDIAVNLLTKDELQGKVNGNAKISSSFFKRYDNDIDIIAIKKRKQILLIGNINNIGEDKNPDFKSSDKGTFYTQNSQETKYFQPTPSFSLDASSFSDNYKPDEKTGFVFPSISFPLSTKVKVIERASLKITESNVYNTQFSKTNISDSVFYILNSNSFSKSKYADYNNSLVVKFDNYKKTAFNLELNSRIINKLTNLTQVQTGSYSDSVYVKSKIPFLNLNLFASGATRIAENKAIGFGVNANFNHDNGYADFSTNRFSEFYNLPENYNFLRQNAEQKNYVIIADVFYLKKLKTGSRSLKISNIYYQNKIDREVFLDSVFVNNKSWLTSSGQKSIRYNKTFIQLSENLYTAKSQPLIFTAAFGQYDLSQFSGKKYFYYSLTAATSVKVTNRIYFSSSIYSGNNMESPSMELNDSLIKDISSLYVSTGEYKPITSHQFSVSAGRRGWVGASLTYSFDWQPQNYVTDIFYDPRLTFYGYRLKGEKFKHKGAIKFKTYSMIMKGSFLLILPGELEKSSGVVNGNSVSVIQRNFSPSFRYVSNFKKLFNFEINYRQNLGEFIQKDGGELKSFYSSMNLELIERIDFSKKFSIGSAFKYLKFKSGDFSMLDIYSIYQFTDRIRFDLKFINVLNQKSSKSEFTDPNNVYRNETYTASPYALVGFSYSF